MSVLFLDGFDKYGPATNHSTNPPNGVIGNAVLQNWTSASDATLLEIGAPLSASGQSLYVLYNFVTVSKTLPGNYTRLVGGCRVMPPSLTSGAGNNLAIMFKDGGSTQFTISLTGAGFVQVIGAVTATSTTIIGQNTAHYIEWDITFHASTGAYQIWVDGVSAMSGSNVNTANGGTSNNYSNGISLQGPGYFDDLYVFSTAGTTNKAVLLTNPRVETTVPTADVQTQFADTKYTLGTLQSDGSTSSFISNSLVLRKVVPEVAVTLNSVSAFVYLTSGAAQNMKGVVYSGTTAPTTLMSSGSAVSVGSGAVSFTTPIVLPLTTPQALSAGTNYWIGYICDSGNAALYLTDATNQGLVASNTYASGAPATAPTMSIANSWLLFGNCAATSTNWSVMNNPLALGNLAYISSATVGNEDLYSFSALSSIPTQIYTVAVSACVCNATTGVRTINLQTKSVGVDATGSTSGISPSTSYTWQTSYFDTDPGTSAAWTYAGLNAASSGLKIAS